MLILNIPQGTLGNLIALQHIPFPRFFLIINVGYVSHLSILILYIISMLLYLIVLCVIIPYISILRI